MTLKNIDGSWYRLSACGFLWKETSFTNLDVKIKVILNEAVVQE
jgi:hypothetical protein